MNSFVKYQLIIILVVLSKLYSSETVICPIKCNMFCECFKNLNGSFVCGNCAFDEMDLSDRDNDAQNPSHTLMTPSVPTSVPNSQPIKYKLELGDKEIIATKKYPKPYPGSSIMEWYLESSVKNSNINLLFDVVDIENCTLDTLEVLEEPDDEWKGINPICKSGPIKLSSKVYIKFTSRSGNLNEHKGFNASVTVTTIKRTEFKTVDKLLIVMACVCIFLFIVFLTVAILVIIKFRQNRLARRRLEREMNQANTSMNNPDEVPNSPSISVISPPSYDTVCAQPPPFLDYTPEEKPLPGSAPPAYASFRSSRPVTQRSSRDPKDVNNPQPSTEA